MAKDLLIAFVKEGLANLGWELWELFLEFMVKTYDNFAEVHRNS